MSESNMSITNSERDALTNELTAIFNYPDTDRTPLPDHLKEVFREFLLGITFPGSVDVGEPGTARREIFTLLSAVYQGMRHHVAVLSANPQAVANAMKAMNIDPNSI